MNLLEGKSNHLIKSYWSQVLCSNIKGFKVKLFRVILRKVRAMEMIETEKK